jgi:hypothetical protein
MQGQPSSLLPSNLICQQKHQRSQRMPFWHSQLINCCIKCSFVSLQPLLHHATSSHHAGREYEDIMLPCQQDVNLCGYVNTSSGPGELIDKCIATFTAVITGAAVMCCALLLRFVLCCAARPVLRRAALAMLCWIASDSNTKST